MKRLSIVAFIVAFLTASAVAFPDGFKRIMEFLTGFEEVPVVSTVANGEFRARIKNDDSEIPYKLSYSGLEGTVLQAHIHFGQKGVNGGISVFLCTNLGNGPVGTQACPPPPATITGTITAIDVGSGATAQGIAPGEFDELIRAMRAGKTYVNVHSTKWPGGEIRSQINVEGDHDDDHHHDRDH